MNAKRILITGGARGIGRAICEEVARQGATVGVNFLDSCEAAAELATLFPERIIPLRADIRDPLAVEMMVEAFVAETGGIDVLVNNAGVADSVLLLRQSKQSIRRTIDTNLIGAITVTQAVLARMVRQRNGLIVFLSSIACDQPRPGLAVYAASKAGIEAFSRSVGLEYRNRGLRTVCLRLGPIRTGMYMKRSEAERQLIEKRLLAGEVPGSDSVARFVAAAIAANDTLLTGSVVTLDNGYSLGTE